MLRNTLISLLSVAGKFSIRVRPVGGLLIAFRVGRAIVVLVVHYVLVAQVLVVGVMQVVVALLDLALDEVGLAGGNTRVQGVTGRA